MYLLFLWTLCSVLGAALLTVSNTLSIERTTNDVITYTGKVTNTSATDKNNRVLLKVVTDTGDVAGSFHSVGKSYSCDLTKSRVRLLGSRSGNLSANASSLRRSLVDGLISESVESTLKRRGLRLGGLVRATFLYELVKGWHDFPPSFKNFIYTKRKLRCIPIFRRKYGLNPYLRRLHPILALKQYFVKTF